VIIQQGTSDEQLEALYRQVAENKAEASLLLSTKIEEV